MQEVLGVYISPFLDTVELKMALRAWKVSGALEIQALWPERRILSPVHLIPARLLREKKWLGKRSIACSKVKERK